MNHVNRLEILGHCLAHHRDYWQSSAFTTPELGWQRRQPELWQWLQSLSDADVEALETDPRNLTERLMPWIDGLGELPSCIAVPQLSDKQLPVPVAVDRLGAGVPGRKWQQVQAFAARVPLLTEAPDASLLEWCAGKGHLGRWLSLTHQRPVAGLEWDPALCEVGNDLSARLGIACHLHEQDVLAQDAGSWLKRSDQVVALHACGDLHERLLQMATQFGVTALSLSPCCYHRRAESVYRPYSVAARRNDLGLNRYALRLCVQETVTAGRRVRRLRDLEVAWRLGFDALQRSLRDTDDYLPLPAPPKAILSDSFSDFCRWAAQAKGLCLPSHLAWGQFEARGRERLRWLRRQELVAHVFRRPLEIWLALDRVCYLEDAGYRVELGTFCERTLTPRNLMINARAAC